MKSRKPVDFELDKDEHPDTMDSIAWAEKQVGSKLPEPPRELDRLRDEEKNLFKVEDYDGTEDADIAQTLRSAH